MKKRERHYDGADSYMAETARTIHALLVQDLAIFSAINTRFTTQFANDFLAQIQAADEVVTDTTAQTDLAVETEQVLTAMDTARQLYNRIKNHAIWAFPSSIAIQKEFTTGYREASRSQADMIVFLDTLEKATQKYLTQLTDPTKGGMPAAIFNEIETVRLSLRQKNTTQEYKKKERPVLTEERINTLNACYDTLMMINSTAQIVFKDQPAKQSQYTYRSVSNAESDHYTGTVQANEIKTITTLVYESGKFISFENKGTVPLQFDLSIDSTTLEGELVELGGGATVHQQMSSLIEGIAEGTEVNILVRNLSTTEQGSYWVSVNNE